jgi:hypothetical protein
MWLEAVMRLCFGIVEVEIRLIPEIEGWTI